MPDIRDILKALNEQDRRLYSQVRTVMRRTYISAVTEVVGMSQYNEVDDAFLDLVDIKIASLFDRSGRFESITGPDEERAAEIEAEINQKASELDRLRLVQKSPKTAAQEQFAKGKTEVFDTNETPKPALNWK